MSKSHKENPNGELHLFIVWHNAKSSFQRIIDDIKDRFLILDVYEIEWSSDAYIPNLTSFYSHSQRQLDSKEMAALMEYKRDYIGTGSFYVILVQDPNPLYSLRKTSTGEQNVNTNMFDAKELYRQWTGGGHLIHATNSEREFVKDSSLLFGPDFKTPAGAWDGKSKQLAKDLTGVGDWKDIKELFLILNLSLDYVVLRNFEPLPEHYYSNEHGDIDLLVEDLNYVRYLTNAEAVFSEPYRVHHKIKIKGEDVFFDFRFVGDHYYDTPWEREILQTRELANGIFRPNSEHYFYSLLYHALVHKNAVSADYKERLIQLGKEIDTEISLDDFDHNRPGVTLTNFMNDKGYQYIKPDDESVTYNHTYIRSIYGFIERNTIDLATPLEFIKPKETLISSRFLASENGIDYWSTVYDDGTAIYKQATGDLAKREAYFLGQLTSSYFPKVIDSWSEASYSVIVLEKVNGKSLVKVWQQFSHDPGKMLGFIDDCLNILDELNQQGITHRDIHMNNIFIRDGKPVLLDFGWAVSAQNQIFTPASLGDTERPPDGSFSDVFSMGKVIEQVNRGRYPEFADITHLMTHPDTSLRIADLGLLKLLFGSAYKKKAETAATRKPSATPTLPDYEPVIDQLMNQILRRDAGLQGFQDEKERSVQQLADRLAEKEQSVQRLADRLAEKERSVQELADRLAKKERSVQELADRLMEKERVIQEFTARLAEKEKSVKSLTGQADHYKRSLAEITGSRLWKIALLVRRLRVLLVPPNSRRARALRGFMHIFRR